MTSGVHREWRAVLHEGGSFQIYEDGAGHKGLPLLICAHHGSVLRADEMHANAKLIASAPKLLEAAQAAWNCIAELPPTQARVEVALLLQAATELATGEPP